ncbi:unnamed protein product [Chrysoparadoxa australica]
MLDAAEEKGIVERKGSWYGYQGKNVAQGRLNTVAFLKENTELAEEISQLIRQGATGSDLAQVEAEAEEKEIAEPGNVVKELEDALLLE